MYNIKEIFDFHYNNPDKSGNKVIKPLNTYQNKNNLDIVTIDDFIQKYNNKSHGPADTYNYITLNSLCIKLQECCSIMKNGKYESNVSGGYIKEKITKHFTEKTSKNKPKYQIYLAIDILKEDEELGDDDVPVIDPLDRIYGLLITDDEPCHCLDDDKDEDVGAAEDTDGDDDYRYLSIVIICANSFRNPDKKAIGSYLLLFALIKGYIYKFKKIILEVSNSESADIPDECYEDGDNIINSLFIKFEEVKSYSKEIRYLKNNPEEAFSNDIYSKFVLDIKNSISNDTYTDSDYKYTWDSEWLEELDFSIDDTSTEFTWPNGYHNEPIGDVTNEHFLRQLNRIPIQEEPTPLNILEIAINVGCADLDYDLNDFVNFEIIKEDNEDSDDCDHENDYDEEDSDQDQDENSEDDEDDENACCDIEIKDNILCNLEDSEQEDDELFEKEEVSDDEYTKVYRSESSDLEKVDYEDNSEVDSEENSSEDSEENSSEDSDLQEPYDYDMRIIQLKKKKKRGFIRIMQMLSN